MNNLVGLVLVCQCCEKYFVICKSCYRGHKYCSHSCKSKGYEATRKTARQKFENSFEAKLDHADRQARYRERQKVTDKSSSLKIKNVNMHSHENFIEKLNQSDLVRCCISCNKVLFPQGVQVYGGSV